MNDTGPEDWRVAPGPADEPERRVGYAGMVAGVDALALELKETRRAVEEDRSIRRLLVWFVSVALLTMLVIGVFGAVALKRLTNTQAENHKLLQTVERVTNPDAVARQQAATGALVAQIISCVENHQDRLVDPAVPLTPGCPETALPTPPAPPQPPPTTTTTTTTAPARVQSTAASRGGGRTPNWEALRQCEAGGDYATNTGNGYYGAYQFSLGTWQGLGYEGLPSDAPPSTQDEAAQRLYADRGASPWPNCGRYL